MFSSPRAYPVVRTRRLPEGSESDIDIATVTELLQAVARAVGTDFESTHGHPPGTNEVVLADGDHELRLLERELDGRVPAQIAAFFRQVTQVSLVDLWNGYFIGPPSWAAGLHEAAEPRFVRSRDTTHEVIVIASNGGGVLYAAPLPSGGPILVLPNGAIENGTYDAREPMGDGFGPVAADIGEFLQRLIDSALAKDSADPFDPYTRT